MILKFDPRTKFMLLVVIGVIMMSGKLTGMEYILRLICATIPFLLLLSIKRFKAAILYAFLMFGVVFCEGLVAPNTSGFVNIMIMTICGVISRFGPGYLMGWYVVSSTSVSEFITAMERMHLPTAITIPMAVMFRYFPTLKEECNSIHDAMKMREIGQSIRNPFTYLEFVLVPIMMSTLQISNDLSAASLTKGLGTSKGRTHICKLQMQVSDWIVISALTAMLVIFFIC